ncbi:MAG: hypothetical protein JWN34_4274 [Bryobacterales bacterium]|nr:hypothetical protein [Bryobacterales bacterium]
MDSHTPASDTSGSKHGLNRLDISEEGMDSPTHGPSATANLVFLLEDCYSGSVYRDSISPRTRSRVSTVVRFFLCSMRSIWSVR